MVDFRDMFACFLDDTKRRINSLSMELLQMKAQKMKAPARLSISQIKFMCTSARTVHGCEHERTIAQCPITRAQQTNVGEQKEYAQENGQLAVGGQIEFDGVHYVRLEQLLLEFAQLDYGHEEDDQVERKGYDHWRSHVQVNGHPTVDGAVHLPVVRAYYRQWRLVRYGMVGDDCKQNDGHGRQVHKVEIMMETTHLVSWRTDLFQQVQCWNGEETN